MNEPMLKLKDCEVDLSVERSDDKVLLSYTTDGTCGSTDYNIITLTISEAKDLMYDLEDAIGCQ